MLAIFLRLFNNDYKEAVHVEETAGAEETDDTQKESETGPAASGEKVNIKLFTGKIETIDVMNYFSTAVQ